jgi:hypothetical protein
MLHVTKARLRMLPRRPALDPRAGERFARPPAPEPRGLNLLRVAFVALALAPPIYLFCAIQYSAITYPYWDHVDLLPWIAAFYDGHVSISSLWAPHNHSRPLLYRVVYMLNARLTGWDIRSEYVYVYLSIYGALALHVRGLWRTTGRRLTEPFLYALVLLSIFFCSPAGHNNHWWSMMFQLDLANLLVVYALWKLAMDPDGRLSNVLAAAAGWAATYTLTNGLVAMLVLAVIAHVSQRPLFVPTWRTAFWVVNLVTILTLYLPGLPTQPGDRPGPVDIARFTCIYIGAPLADLLHYPFHGIFDQPRTTWFTGLIGLLLILLVSALCVSGRRRIRAGETPALVLLGFSLFAVGSGLLTAWGRARFDAIGVAEALSSRYTIFSSFLIYGLIVYVASLAASGRWQLARPRRLSKTGRFSDAQAAVATIVLAAVVAFGTLTYYRGVAVYRNAHLWNDLLATAYSFAPKARSLDRIIYPDPARAEKAKSTLLRLRLGPYRNVAEVAVSSPSVVGAAQFKSPVLLTPSTPVYEEFRAQRRGLAGLSVTVITWGRKPAGVIYWKLVEVARTKSRAVASGALLIDSVRDWGALQLPVGYVGGKAGTRYGLEMKTATLLPQPFGFPLFAGDRTTRGTKVVVGGQLRRGLSLHLTQSYVVG